MRKKNCEGETHPSYYKEYLDKKVLGRTGIEVGIVGLGTAFLGVPGNEAAKILYQKPSEAKVDYELGVQTVIAALAAGVSLIDTAPKYVNGQSELMIAEAFRRCPEFKSTCTVTTKVGYYPENFDYSYDATMKCFEASQLKLQRDIFNIVYIHDPMGIAPEKIMGKGGTIEALRKLQKEGSVKYIGIAADDPACNAD